MSRFDDVVVIGFFAVIGLAVVVLVAAVVSYMSAVRTAPPDPVPALQFSPACTCSTARMRMASRVLWSSFRASRLLALAMSKDYTTPTRMSTYL